MKINEQNSEIGMLLSESQTSCCFVGNQTGIVWQEDEGIATALIYLNNAADWIEKSRLNPFKTKNNRYAPCTVESPAGLSRLWLAVSTFGHVIAYRASKYALNPKVAYMLDKLAFLMLYQKNSSGQLMVSGRSAENLVLKLNKAVAEVKEYFASKECKRKILDFTKGSKDNFRSLIAYFKALFMKRSRYLVVRLDLEYRSSSQVLTDSFVSISYEEARRHREMFFEKVLRTYKDIEGYVWKMEHGINRGFHYHVVFFIDSRNNPQDITVARMLGRVWEEDITQGIGFAYNCNAVKSKYKSCGIGMIDHHDPEAMAGLVKIAQYLTKQDEFMRLKLDGAERTLGKGQIRYGKNYKGGRPRMHESALILA